MVHIRGNSITLSGWAIGKSPDSKATFRVEGERHQPVKFRHVNTCRDSVSQIYPKKVYGRGFGSDIQFLYERGEDYYLLTRCEGRQARIEYNKGLIARRASMAYKCMEKLRDLTNMEIVHAAMDFRKEHDLKALVTKSKHKLQGIDNDYDYNEQCELTGSTGGELAKQKKRLFDFESMLFVVTPAYKTSECYLREVLDSIMEQAYTNWEICVADGSPGGGELGRVLKKYMDRDRRVRYEILGSNRGVSDNTNTTLGTVRRNFIIPADRDDTLPLNALYEVVKAINGNPDCQTIYSDKDKLGMDRKALSDPHSGPGFNPDLLVSIDYIYHLFAIRQNLLKQVGGFRQEFDGARDYDSISRRTEAAKRVYHIPKVLYHWRCHQNSTASNPESKIYAFGAESGVITAHYERMGIPTVKVEKGVDYGIYHTTSEIQGEPLVSVITPNKDHSQDLGVCVRSLTEKSSYRNLEFIIVENNSSQEETFACYNKMQAEHTNFRIAIRKEGFSYSTINNHGASFAKGEYLLLLSNDTGLVEEDSIDGMLGFCQREDVDTTGVRLLHGGDTIQYAGVVIGLDGIASHTSIGFRKAENSYFHRAMYAQDYSVVTAACLMTKKSVFDQVEGLSPELVVAFNDIDYCMKIRALGKMVVYTLYSYFHHCESKSRGLEDTPEKIARFNRGVTTSIQKWPDTIQNGDPRCSPNLTLRKFNFTLGDLLKGKIGKPYDLKVYGQFAPENDTKTHE